MTIKPPDPGFQHKLPYIVFAILIALAVGVTLFASSFRRTPVEKESKPPVTKPTSESPKPEDVLGFRFSDKSHLGATALQGVVYGRESDLLKVLGNSKIPLTLDLGEPDGNAGLRAPLDRLKGTQQSPPAPNPVAVNHVVIVVTGARAFLELVTAVRMDAKKPPEQRTFASKMDPNALNVADEGTTSIDSKGNVSVVVGSEDGVEIDVSSSEPFKVTIPEGGTRFSVSAKS